MVDLGILDVMQRFGRAGRPQYDTFGHGTIITLYDKLAHYLSLLTRQNPIESQFIQSLTDNLNAEVNFFNILYTKTYLGQRWSSLGNTVCIDHAPSMHMVYISHCNIAHYRYIHTRCKLVYKQTIKGSCKLLQCYYI